MIDNAYNVILSNRNLYKPIKPTKWLSTDKLIISFRKRVKSFASSRDYAKRKQELVALLRKKKGFPVAKCKTTEEKNMIINI